MKAKILLDRNASSSSKSNVISRIVRDLGSKATISGDVITVDEYDARKVTEILDRERIGYSRSTV